MNSLRVIRISSVFYVILLYKIAQGTNRLDASCAVKNLIDHEQITLSVMGWLNKIFKGSSHRHCHEKYEEDTTSYAPSGVSTLIQSYSILFVKCNSAFLDD